MPKVKATFGVDFNKFDSQRSGELPPGDYVFKITDVRWPNLDDAGHRWANMGCTVIRPKKWKRRMKWEVVSMAPNRIGFLKAFFEDIGRADILKKKGTPADAVGTVFEATIQKRGNFYDLVNRKPVDADDVDDDDLDEEAEEPEDEDEDSEDDDDEDDDDDASDEDDDEDEDEEDDEPPPPKRKAKKKPPKMKRQKTAPRKSGSARRR